MEQKEIDWHIAKAGYFSASRIKNLMSKSGKFTEGNIDYLYEIQQQRTTKEPEPPIFAKPMQLGIENEPYAIEWVRENTPHRVLHCDKDFRDKIFEKTDYGFGASPDAFIVPAETEFDKDDSGLLYYDSHVIDNISALLEVKCVVGRKECNWYYSPTVPLKEKRARAFEEHKDQMAAQLLAYPSIKRIYLLKYRPQIDDNPWDTTGVLAPERGLLFTYARSAFGSYINQIKRRVRFADKYLRDSKNPDDVNRFYSLLKDLDKIITKHKKK
jgi:hypothetical protein